MATRFTAFARTSAEAVVRTAACNAAKVQASSMAAKAEELIGSDHNALWHALRRKTLQAS